MSVFESKPDSSLDRLWTQSDAGVSLDAQRLKLLVDASLALSEVRDFAQLHHSQPTLLDGGKITVPDAILKEPNPLTTATSIDKYADFLIPYGEKSTPFIKLHQNCVDIRNTTHKCCATHKSCPK